MHTLPWLAACVAALSGCSQANHAPPRAVHAGDGHPSCTVAGVERAHPVAPVALPVGCNVELAGTLQAPRAIRSPAELDAALHCDGSAPPTVDLAQQDLFVVGFSRSPANAGTEILDDGSTVTFAMRERPPCEGAPLPMPTPTTLIFALPKGAARTFRTASCALPVDCR